MSTRFRLPSAGTPEITPAWQGYTHATAVQQRPLPLSDASPLTTITVAPDSADHLVAGDTLHWQGISAPLAAGQAFTPETVLTLVMPGSETSSGNNLVLQLYVAVVSRDGSVVLAILRDKVGDNLEFGGTLTSRLLVTTLSGGYLTTGGERLVVEISVTGTPVDTGGIQGHNAALRWGANGTGDLPQGNLSASTTLNPWIEFTDTLMFEATPMPALPLCRCPDCGQFYVLDTRFPHAPCAQRF